VNYRIEFVKQAEEGGFWAERRIVRRI